MKLLRSRTAAALLVLVAVASCTDREPVLPPPSDPPRLGEVRCAVNVTTGAVQCAAPGSADASTGPGKPLARLVPSGAAHDEGAGTFALDVALLNLRPELLGTRDGTTTEGIVVYVDSIAASGATVTLGNADGTGPLEGRERPYFAYDEVVEPNGTSEARRWAFVVPAGVSEFRFSAYVEAPVHPGPWNPAPEPTELRWRTVEGNSLWAISLRAIWAASPEQWWAVGDGKAILRRDAGGMVADAYVGSGFPDLSGIWGRGPDEVYAVGGASVIRWDGSAWAEVQRLAGTTLYAIDGSPTGSVYAVGQIRHEGAYKGYVARLTAGGSALATSMPQGGGGQVENYLGVAADGATVLAVGESYSLAPGHAGLISRSTDAGATWTSTVSDGATLPERTYRGVDLRGATAVVVGRQVRGLDLEGLILVSSDGGVSWAETVSSGPVHAHPAGGMATSRIFHDVHVSPSGEILVFGEQRNASGQDEALVLRSVDGGRNWTEENPAGSAFGLSGGAVVDGHVLAVGRRSTVLHHDGSGWRFEQEAYEPFPELLDVWASGPALAVAVGRLAGDEPTRGLVRRWNGSGWSDIAIAPRGGRYLRLTSVGGAGERVVAAGFEVNHGTRAEAAVIVSGDAGRSWSFAPLPGAGSASRSLAGAAAADAARLYAVGSDDLGAGRLDGVVLGSVDGGATWSASVSQGPAHACGSGCTGRIRNLQDVAAGAGGRVFAVGYQVDAAGVTEALVLRSTDAGASWTSHTSSPAAGRARRLDGVWVSGDTVVAVGAEGSRAASGETGFVMRSVDGGATWETSGPIRGVRGPTWLLSVDRTTGGTIHAVGHSGEIFRSGDAGRTWAEDVGSAPRTLEGIAGTGEGAWAVAAGGTILRGVP